MVLWMPSFISFFEMPSIMNLASLVQKVPVALATAVDGQIIRFVDVAPDEKVVGTHLQQVLLDFPSVGLVNVHNQVLNVSLFPSAVITFEPAIP